MSFVLKAQDTLKLKDGSVQLVKIIEVSETTLKYKKSDNLSGPTFVLPVQEVNSISYANGLKEKFDQATQTTSYSANENASFTNYSPSYKKREAARLAKIKKPWKKSGPRIGFTYLGEGQVSDWINDQGKNPFVTQIGWELESRIFTSGNGIAAVVEYMGLVGGMEQGLIMPSASILLALRGPEGMEFAVGPNYFYYDTYYLFGMEFSAGTTLQFSDIYLPINLSFVPSIKRSETVVEYNGKITQVEVQSGFRVNLTIGFYYKKK